MKSDSEFEQMLAAVSVNTDENSASGKDEFDQIFGESVYEGLRWTSGLVANILQSFLQDAMAYETGWGKSNRSVKDAATLEKGLERIFGFGAKIFEKKILEILYSKLQLGADMQHFGHDFKFSKEVKKAKKLFKSRLSPCEGLNDEKCKSKDEIEGT